MTNVHVAILKLLCGFQRTYGKKYSRPPQKLILKKLLEYHKIDISLRTLNRRLKELREWGYLYRIVRHIRGRGIKMVCRATAYYLLEKTTKYFRWVKRSAEGVLLRLGLPKLAHDLLLKENIIFKAGPSNVEILLKSVIKGRASPSEAIL